MRAFQKHGTPEQDPNFRNQDIEAFDYLFMGNFVGYGKQQLLIVFLLFALKTKYQNAIHLLRGC